MSSLFSALSVSASGMAAQRTRAALLVENIANSETTRTPEGGPYRRKDAIFSSDDSNSAFADELDAQLDGQQLTGVKVTGISVDHTPPEKQYMPGHPDADADGYVSVPKLNPAEDMVDLMSANRSYQANVSAMSAVKDMIQKSIDLLR
jgi:flagellar basal-body rod protein FlgC